MRIGAQYQLDLLATLKHRCEITLVFTFACVYFTNFFEKCLKKTLSSESHAYKYAA